MDRRRKSGRVQKARCSHLQPSLPTARGCVCSKAKWEVPDARDGCRWNAASSPSSDVDVRGTASWSPDGKWIVVAGSDREGTGLFKLPVDGGAPVQIVKGPFLDPVWSPRGDLIVYCGTQVFTRTPLLAVHPDGTPVKLPEINVQRGGERARFLPNGTGLVYIPGDTLAGQDFWLLDLSTMRSRRLTQLNISPIMRTFDITSRRKADCVRPTDSGFGHIAH